MNAMKEVFRRDKESLMKDANIYVVTHKKYKLSDYLKNQGYKLISVGNANKVNNAGEKDNTGDNISEKNANYCELTALYWAWKNDRQSKYKGLCHYRRYFTTSIFSKDEKKYLTIDDVEKLLKKADIIVPEKQYFVRSARENYLRCGYQEDLQITYNVLKEKYPEYLEIYDKVLDGNWSYLTNMLIAPKKIFDDYCEWLFDILFEVEKRTDITGYSIQEARIFGYISERLLTVWLLKNQYSVIEKHTVNTEEKLNYIKEIMIKLKIYQFLKTMIWKIRNK